MRFVISAFLSIVACGASTAAQTAPKDAAYWRAYVASFKPKSTVVVRLHDGSRVQGRLVTTTGDDMLIRVKRLPFRHRLERRVRFDAVETLRRTHPTRDLIIGEAAAVGLAFLFIAAGLS
jgi:hypothetical protein